MRSQRGQKWIVGGLGLFVLLAAAACSDAARHCEQCGRTECHNLAFTIRLADGERIETCCPRCGLHYLRAEQPQVAGLAVRDFDTAESLDATRAVYVEGSDVHPCRGLATEPPRSERGCCLTATFDRCEPSVVAFSDEEHARKFIALHGGTISGWGALSGSLH